MATTLKIDNFNYNVNSTYSYHANNYSYTFTIYNLNKSQYYDNINNIIPNPLYKGLVNYNYKSYNYATSDLDGETNTSYLKRNDKNIANTLDKDFYVPALGELGIFLENIQTINNAIDNLGYNYAYHKISEDQIYVSSTLRSSENINNSEYTLINNLDNVWTIDTKNAKMSYSSISNNYNILPFYNFNNDILVDIDINNDDIILNSLNNKVNYIIEKNNKLYYNEYNSPYSYKDGILTTNENNTNTYTKDYNVNDWVNWEDNPFSSKYFFMINFDQANSTIKNEILNDHYTFKTNYINNPNNIGYIYNNGIDIKTNNFSYLSYIYYNIPIYHNTLTLIPIYGSGENNYNLKKNKPICSLYIAIPKLSDYFNIEIDNCDTTIKELFNFGQFKMYNIKFSFKSHYPVSNIIQFKILYKGKEYKRKYYFNIYSLTLSNILSSKDSDSTYININNFYTSKESYYWWEYNANYADLNDNKNKYYKLNGKFCDDKILDTISINDYKIKTEYYTEEDIIEHNQNLEEQKWPESKKDTIKKEGTPAISYGEVYSDYQFIYHNESIGSHWIEEENRWSYWVIDDESFELTQEEQVNIYNAKLTGALESNKQLNQENVNKYNIFIGKKNINDILTEEEANKYNATLDDAKKINNILSQQQEVNRYNAILTGGKKKNDILTEEEANAYNATLDGALNSEDTLTAEQANAYNMKFPNGDPLKESGNELSEEEANAYNATLDGALNYIMQHYQD